jgi:hypothetical protein
MCEQAGQNIRVSLSVIMSVSLSVSVCAVVMATPPKMVLRTKKPNAISVMRISRSEASHLSQYTVTKRLKDGSNIVLALEGVVAHQAMAASLRWR